MKKEELFQAMQDIDEAYILQAREPVRRRPVWLRWTAAAACLAIAAAGVWAYTGMEADNTNTGANETNATMTPTTEESNGIADTENSVAYGFTLEENGVVYFPISFEDRRRYGLVDPDAMGLTKENIYRITEEDLGEYMGEVTACGDADMNGCKVYHFAKFPEYNSICIVEHDGSYTFYTADGPFIDPETGRDSDRVLEIYGMPDSVVRIELQNGAWEHQQYIEDRETIEAFCRILSGKTGIGMQAHNRMFAELWQTTYGNEDVSFDGETCVFANMEVYDQAHELWGRGERVVWIETDRGFRFYFIYVPSVGTISGPDYYVLSAEENAELSRLFNIEE